MREMNEEETKKWLSERQRELTEEDYKRAEIQQKRFEELSRLGRVAKVRGLIETPDVILDKMLSGFENLLELPIEDEMLDSALSVQSERLQGLSIFFSGRDESHPHDANDGIASDLRDLHESVEELRMEILQSGDRSVLEDVREKMVVVRDDILDLWSDEDEGEGEYESVDRGEE